MTAFFAQWLDGTGAPAFTNKYSVFRLGDNKGFRTIGAIDQDLDLFRMPVELRIETDGKTEIRRVDVSGTDSHYAVETFGRPRRISIDPENWLLKSTPDLAVRVAVLRGQQQVAQGDLTAALVEYQKALDANKNSSLATYRIGEIFFMQRNYQSAANSFRDALRGDGDPKWIEVWSHIELGTHLRRHRPARPRRQRVPPRRPDQRQHPGRRQRGPRPHADSPTNANTPTTRKASRARASFHCHCAGHRRTCITICHELTHAILLASVCAFIANFIYGGVLFGALPGFELKFAKYPAVYTFDRNVQ